MDSVIVGIVPNDSIETQVDQTYQALRASIRPLEWQGLFGGISGGHYACDAITGTIAAGIANAAQVFQIRWADPTKLFVLLKFYVQAGTTTAFTTLNGADLELIVGHGATANGSGGNIVSLTGQGNKMRASMAPSCLVTSGEIRVSSTAALTIAPGQTLEPAGIGYARAVPFAVNTLGAQITFFDVLDAPTHPLILMSGDTLVVRTANVGATGVWNAAFWWKWAELSVY